MITSRTVTCLSFVLYLGLGIAHATELRVTLFGQPCLLDGPLDSVTLKTLHSISPDQVGTAENATEARSAIDKIQKAGTIPAALETYRNHMKARLEAQLSFYEALAEAKKSLKISDLLANTKKHLLPARKKGFETLAKKLESKLTLPATAEQLAELYNESIQPDPEEDFHRAIRRLKVHYSCTFEDQGAHEVDEPEPKKL